MERKADEYAASIAALEAEIGALTRKRDTMRTDRDKELERLKMAVSKEHEAYSTALDEWEG